MAEEKSETQRQTLEMRVAAIEDKLAAFQITEQEMAAYQKVSSLLAGGQAAAPAAAAPTLSPIVCIIPRYQPCIVQQCIRYQPCYRYQPCINECTCGPCSPQISAGFGSSFGGFGT
jgi:hypothetical protein